MSTEDKATNVNVKRYFSNKNNNVKRYNVITLVDREAYTNCKKSMLELQRRGRFQRYQPAERIGDLISRANGQFQESPREAKAQRIANRMANKLNDQKSIKFYLKCAWHLSEDEIWSTIELATRPGIKHPERYAARVLSSKMET